MKISFQSNEKNRQLIIKSILVIVIVYSLFTYFVSLLAFISPSQKQRWDTSIQTITPSTIKPGKTVTVTGFLEEGTQYLNGYYHDFTSPEEVTWIVIVIDPNNIPIHMEWDTIPSASGDRPLDTFSFNLPATAVKGTYKIRVLVWTKWLPDGEARTNIINEKSFEVV